MAINELWTYREPSWHDVNVEGFTVEALDGTIGHVQEAIRTPGFGDRPYSKRIRAATCTTRRLATRVVAMTPVFCA